MANNLKIFGVTYSNAKGIKAKDTNDNLLTFTVPALQTKSATPTESAQTITPDSGYDGLSQVNVGAIDSSYVGSGITRRSSTDLTASGATVTVPSGYYSSQASKAVASGSATPAATISATGATVTTGTNTLTFSKSVSNTPTVSAGYIASGTAGNSSVSLTASVTTQGAQTIYPSTTDQTIAASRYLTGAQTIKAVTTSNLTAANIKSGVTVTVGDSTDADRILSVTGTYEGEGGASSIGTKTLTNSTNTATSLAFTSMSGQPIAWFLRCTTQIQSSGSTAYYYVDNIRYNGTNTQGTYVRIGSTRGIYPDTTHYSSSYSGTTLTISTSASRTTAGGSFYNGTYELVYIY